MRIGTVALDGSVFLAPMAGVTDSPYRILAREMGCAIVYSEMVSDKGINYRNCHTLEMLKSEAGERPLALQLFGSEPESVARAVSYVCGLGAADIIDFNMGCPAPKVVKNNEGSALMKHPALAYEIMRAAKESANVPVTVKMRKGWDASSVNVVEMAKLAEKAGMDAVAVHGRTREEFYGGQADWRIIAEVKKSVAIPVIGNGDIRTESDLARMFAETNCDAAMIGRAAQGNPWIFRAMRAFMETGRVLPPPTLAERKEVILRHLDMLIGHKGAYIGPREMRKHATWYVKGLAHSAELRAKFNRAETREDFQRILDALPEQ